MKARQRDDLNINVNRNMPFQIDNFLKYVCSAIFVVAVLNT